MGPREQSRPLRPKPRPWCGPNQSHLNVALDGVTAEFSTYSRGAAIVAHVLRCDLVTRECKSEVPVRDVYRPP